MSGRSPEYSPQLDRPEGADDGDDTPERTSRTHCKDTKDAAVDAGVAYTARNDRGDDRWWIHCCESCHGHAMEADRTRHDSDDGLGAAEVGMDEEHDTMKMSYPNVVDTGAHGRKAHRACDGSNAWEEDCKAPKRTMKADDSMTSLVARMVAVDDEGVDSADDEEH